MTGEDPHPGTDFGAGEQDRDRPRPAGPWLAVHVHLPASVDSSDAMESDLVANLLFELGAQGLEWRDEHRPIEAVAAFPAEDELEAERLAEAVPSGLRALGLEAEVADVCVYDDVDWSTHWRGLYEPLEFGPLWVVPSWLPAPDGAKHVLRIDPSSAFGTGIHPTTALCLEWVIEAKPSELLDVGTGTGILALAAVLLGARRAVGIDNDPEAIRVAAANRERNGVSPSALVLAEHADGQYGAVVANILATPLITLAQAIANRVSPGGSLVLSGLLSHQVDAVALAYEALGLTPVEQMERGGWARVHLVRPPD